MSLAILSALPEEQQGLVESMEQAQCQLHAGRKFWRGRLHGVDVVCALCGIGKVAAATTTAALIERLGATAIVFTGVAGGLGAGVQVGDVVVARSFLQHDMDASPIFPRWQMPGYGRTVLDADMALTARLAQATQLVLTRWEGSELNGARVHGARMHGARMHGASMHQGLVASGDRFVSTHVESQRLRQELQTAGHTVLAVEMEGAAVAQACLDYGVPFAAMRTISDRADDSAHVDFATFVRDVASRYAQEVVKQLLLIQ